MPGHGLLGLLPQPAFGRVEDAPDRDGVVGVDDGVQVGEGVLDLAPFVEAGAADDPVGDPRLTLSNINKKKGKWI